MVTPLACSDGQLASSKGTIFTCPTGVRVLVKCITLVNTDSVPRTVNLYVNRTGTSRRIITKDQALAAGGSLVFNDIVVLESSDVVEGDCSAATVVDYQISGVQIT